MLRTLTMGNNDMSIKAVRQAINEQWQAMINSDRIPVMEYKLANGDWLVVEINYQENYLAFSFDQDNKPCFFDRCIKGDNGFYRYPLDEYFDSIDHYLQEIHQNIIEGFLIPNNLDCVDGD